MHIGINDANNWIQRVTIRNAASVARERLLSTGEAAQELGVNRTTLLRWWQDGKVEPEYVTPGNHARWNLAALKMQLRGDRRRDSE